MPRKFSCNRPNSLLCALSCSTPHAPHALHTMVAMCPAVPLTSTFLPPNGQAALLTSLPRPSTESAAWVPACSTAAATGAGQLAVATPPEDTTPGASHSLLCTGGSSCVQRNGHVKGQQLAAVGARHLDAKVCVAPPRCRDRCLQQGTALSQLPRFHRQMLLKQLGQLPAALTRHSCHGARNSLSQ